MFTSLSDQGFVCYELIQVSYMLSVSDFIAPWFLCAFLFLLLFWLAGCLLGKLGGFGRGQGRERI